MQTLKKKKAEKKEENYEILKTEKKLNKNQRKTKSEKLTIAIK